MFSEWRGMGPVVICSTLGVIMGPWPYRVRCFFSFSSNVALLMGRDETLPMSFLRYASMVRQRYSSGGAVHLLACLHVGIPAYLVFLRACV